MNRPLPNDTSNRSASHPISASTAPLAANKSTGDSTSSTSSAAATAANSRRDGPSINHAQSSVGSSSSSTSSKRTRKRKMALRMLYTRGNANRLSHQSDGRGDGPGQIQGQGQHGSGSAADGSNTVTTWASGSNSLRDNAGVAGDGVTKEETEREEPQMQREQQEEDEQKDTPHVALSWIQNYIELQQYHLLNGDVNVSSKGPRKNKRLAKWVGQQKMEYWKWKAIQQKMEQGLEIEEHESCEINEERIQLLENIGMEWDFYPTVSYNNDNGGSLDASIKKSTKNDVSTNNAKENASNALNLLLLAHSKSDASGSEEASSSPTSPASSSSSFRSNQDASSESKVSATAVSVGTASVAAPAASVSAASAQGPLPRSNSIAAAAASKDCFDHEEWMSRYMDLVRFHSQFQHTDVPLTYPPNCDLALWAAEQRKQYKLLLRGKPSKMTNFHLQLLEKIGFQLKDSEGSEWKLRFQEMQLFRSRYGHYNINSKAGVGSEELEQWVRVQTEQQKLLEEGKPSYLNEERLTLLKTIGFPWDGKTADQSRHDSSANSATSAKRKRQFSASRSEQELAYSELTSALAASAKRIKFETSDDGIDEGSRQISIPEDRGLKLTAARGGFNGHTQNEMNLDSKPRALSPPTSNNQSLTNASYFARTIANASVNQNQMQLNQDLISQILRMQSNNNSTQQQQQHHQKMTQSSASANNVAMMAALQDHATSANIATSAPSSESIAHRLSLQNNGNSSAGSLLNDNNSINSSNPIIAQLLRLQKMQAEGNSSVASMNSTANAPIGANNPNNNNALNLLLAQLLRTQSSNNRNISPSISNPNNGPSTNNTSNAINNHPLAQLLQLQNQIVLKKSSDVNHSNFLPSPEYSNHVRNASSSSVMGPQNQAIEQVGALTLQQLLRNNTNTSNIAQNLNQGNNSVLGMAFPSLATGVQQQQQQSCIQALQAQIQGSNASSNNLNSNNNANLANVLKMIFASQQQQKPNTSSSHQQSQTHSNQLQLQQSDLLQQLSAANRVAASVVSSSAAGPSPNMSQQPEQDSSYRKKSRSSTGKGEQWFRRFNELKMYKAINGNCNVPKRFEENPALGTWVSNQRSLRRLMMEGKPSHMTPERVQLLESLGFEWHPPAGPNARQEEQWRARFKELEEFKREHHHCRVPTKNYQPNPALGQWVNDQRRQYRLMNQGLTSSMTVERMMLLTNLGFEWSLGKRKSSS
mmetsp:Transcript_32050/g.65414  ORF Transcript_32050/g.65414 Transcript_32050/m.65414 type:complete len:1215 (+) Transcript_32050:49-3693(+)